MTTDIRQIIEAALINNKKELFEGSLSRIMQHVENAKKVGFAILTSWRKSEDIGTRKTKFAELKSKVKNMGLGYVQLTGHWRECQDPNVNYDACPPEELEDSLEPVLMIIGINKEGAIGLGQEYNQDAVIYGGPETGGSTLLVFRDGSSMDVGAFNPMRIGQAFTEFRKLSDKEKRTGTASSPKAGNAPHFAFFEGFSYPAQSYVEKLAESQLRKNIKTLQEGLKTIPKK